MEDETTDVSNKEQVVIIFRHVNNNDFSVEEEFIDLYCIPSILILKYYETYVLSKLASYKW